jgi:hypothetical protein
MPTLEEMKKALAYKQLEDANKKLAYSAHQSNVKLAETVRIPYRIVIDNLNSTSSRGQKISEYYPKQNKTMDFLTWINEAHRELLPVFADLGSRMHYLYKPGALELSEQGKALHEEYEASQRTFKNDLERQYYFAHFLQGYDIASFSMFDCYGSKNAHTQAEYEQFKADCIQLQTDYYQHKEKYYHDHKAADEE